MPLLLIATQAFGAAAPVDGTPVRGLWWNPGNSGHGIDLHRQTGTSDYTMLWFTYDEQGTGTWYAGSGKLDGDHLVMQLLEFRWNGASAEPRDAGSAEWVFESHEQARLDWRIGDRQGSEPLVPFEYTPGLTSLPLSGLWYDPSEPGWGLSVSTAGRIRVVIAYYYDQSGVARWAIGSGAASELDVPLLSFTGTCLGCPPAEASSTVTGSVALEPQFDAIGVDLDIQDPATPWQRLVETTRLTEPVYHFGLPDNAEATEVLAFAAVNILPMDRDEVLEDHVVMTRQRLIETVSPMTEADIPQGTRLIVRPGAWLMPGLTDAHVHLPFAFSVGEDLFVFMAYGVTTIRGMWGNDLLVDQRNSLAAADAFAPRIFTAGPGIESPGFWPGTVEVQNAVQARSAVSQMAGAGYDYIKIYNRQTPDVYAAIMDQATILGIDVVGHIPFAVDLQTALNGPQRSIEHLRGYPPRVTQARVDSWNTSLDPLQVQRWAETTISAEVWNCPTQVALEHKGTDVPELAQTPAFQALSSSYQGLLLDPSTQPFAQSPLSISNERAMIRALADAGAPLLVGTDAGIRFTLPGWSIHEELQIFIEAGVSPYTTLRSATYEFARFMRAEDRWGSIRPGLEADLLLVEGDPLEDVSRLLHNRLGVMVRGVWMSRSAIDDKLEELAADQVN